MLREIYGVSWSKFANDEGFSRPLLQTIITSRHGVIMEILHNLKLCEKVEIERKKIQLSFDFLQDKALVVKAIIILRNNF